MFRNPPVLRIFVRGFGLNKDYMGKRLCFYRTRTIRREN